MIKGLWTVEFKTNISVVGYGVVVFENGIIAGGDSGYYYIGTYSQNENTIEGEIKIKKYNPDAITIFGPLEYGEIKFTGSYHGHVLSASGELIQSPGLSISIKGTKKESF